MFIAPEQFADFNKSNVDAALKFAKVTFDATERLLGLQLAVGRDALSEAAKNSNALSEVRDVQDLTALRGKFAEAGTDKWTDYSKAVYEVAQHTQSEFSSLVENQLAEISKNMTVALDKAVKSAPAGTDVAFAAFKSSMTATTAAIDSITKATKQVASFADANVKAATNATNTAVKSAKK
ncbi:MAG: phasin family protein [Burkholderiales bacterium]